MEKPQRWCRTLAERSSSGGHSCTKQRPYLTREHLAFIIGKLDADLEVPAIRHAGTP
jgi:hypothetical protein